MDFIDYREKLGIVFNDNDKFKYFKQKIFNVLNIISDDCYSGCIDYDEYFNFCDITGMPLNTNYSADYHNRSRFEHCLSIIERTTILADFLAYYIALVNSVKTNKYSDRCWTRSKFSNLLCKTLEESHIPFELAEDNNEYFVFPKGAKELDNALVSEPLDWLTDYPVAHKAFVKALKTYSEATEDNASDVADLFRKALETFFQEFFNTPKTLENLKSEYGTYMKSKGVPAEISGNFETLLQAYTNFINNYAKHRDETSDTVLEYIMYQTGNIIRLLLTLKGATN